MERRRGGTGNGGRVGQEGEGGAGRGRARGVFQQIKIYHYTTDCMR